MKIFLYAIVCEALVQLWFRAEPLQPLRWFLIRSTPWLTLNGEHLFECKYCTSFWIGMLLAFMFWTGFAWFTWFVYGVVFHRLSNFLHLIFSFILDLQMNLRIRRSNGNF